MVMGSGICLLIARLLDLPVGDRDLHVPLSLWSNFVTSMRKNSTWQRAVAVEFGTREDGKQAPERVPFALAIDADPRWRA